MYLIYCSCTVEITVPMAVPALMLHTTLVIRQTLTLILAMKIMAGRRGGRRNAGGRGNISLTPAELNALINE